MSVERWPSPGTMVWSRSIAGEPTPGPSAPSLSRAVREVLRLRAREPLVERLGRSILGAHDRLIDGPPDRDAGVVEPKPRLRGAVVGPDAQVLHVGARRQRREASREARGGPHRGRSVVIERLADPSAERRAAGPDVDGDDERAADGDPHELAHRRIPLEVEATDDPRARPAQVDLRVERRQAGRLVDIAPEQLDEEA